MASIALHVAFFILFVFVLLGWTVTSLDVNKLRPGDRGLAITFAALTGALSVLLTFMVIVFGVGR